MAIQKLAIQPGVYREGTSYSAEGRWFDGDKIRFRSGNAEKIGGWQRLSNNSYLGTARALWNWVALAGSNYVGVGTNLKYYIESGGGYNDITPIRKIVNPMLGPVPPSTGNPFATAFSTLSAAIDATQTTITLTSAASFSSTGGIIKIDTEEIFYNQVSGNSLIGLTRGYNGTTAASHLISASVACSTIVVTDINHGATQNDFVTYSGVTGPFGGFTAANLNKEQQVLRVLSTTQYSINISGAFSTSAASGGGTVAIAEYQIVTGLDTYVVGLGWGSDPWPTPSNFTLTNPFTTTNASGTIVVAHTAHGLTNGQYVRFSGASAVGGVSAVLLNGAYQITYINANSYSFALGNDGYGTPLVATSAATGGGTVTASYQTGSRGWGAAGVLGIGQQLRLWSADNYGQDLILAPRGGAIFYWEAALGLTVRAKFLSAESTLNGFQGQFVPTTTNEISASALQRFVICFGANPYDPGNPNTTFDPMLVRWSDQENPYEWVPSITNQSGEFRLSHGSYIVTANSTRQETLVWTDSALYSMQYLGAPYVYGFNLLMDNLSVMSPNATVTANNVTYWMGRDKFYSYSGRVETLPCALRQYIFNDINTDQAFQVFSGSNEAYNEVWWFYCSNGSTIVDKYVIYNYLENLWYYGTLSRTAWLDSPLREYPMAAGYENRIIYHEVGTDDVAGTSALPITAYIQSADFDIGDGDHFAFIWRILPDINFNGSNVNMPSVNMEITPRRNSGAAYSPADNPTVTSQDNYTLTRSYNIQEFTGQVYTRLRGRQMALRIESTNLGVAWQLGSIRADIKSDGRR
jgi:hypothetical protein